TPYNALKYQGVWGCILVLTGSFDLLTDLVIIAAFVFYGLIVMGVMILRKKEPLKVRPFKTIGYPLVPVLFSVFCVALLVITFFESPGKSLVGMALILSGLPFYVVWKNGHRHKA